MCMYKFTKPETGEIQTAFNHKLSFSLEKIITPDFLKANKGKNSDVHKLGKYSAWL